MKIISNSNIFAISNIWTKEYLIQVLTSGKNPILTDPFLINAFMQINREDFLPEKFKQIAYADYEINIGYGQTLTKPTIVAQMLSYLKPKYGGKYLDIGTGTGYVAALLGFVAADKGHVYSLERVQWLWENARGNIQKYKSLVNTVSVLYRDGKDGFSNYAPYDGIHISFAMEDISETLKMQLKPKNGILVVPTIDHNLRVIERISQTEWIEEIVEGFVFSRGEEGLA